MAFLNLYYPSYSFWCLMLFSLLRWNSVRFSFHFPRVWFSPTFSFNRLLLYSSFKNIPFARVVALCSLFISAHVCYPSFQLCSEHFSLATFHFIVYFHLILISCHWRCRRCFSFLILNYFFRYSLFSFLCAMCMCGLFFFCICYKPPRLPITV